MGITTALYSSGSPPVWLWPPSPPPRLRLTLTTGASPPPGPPPSATESSPPATDAVDTSLARGALDTPPPDTDTALLTTVDTPLPSWPGLPRVSTDTSVMARG